MLRLLLAFLAVVLLVPAVVALMGAFAVSPDRALRLVLVTSGGVAGLGMPAFLLFRCRGWWRPWQFMAAGACLGLLASPVLVPAAAPHRGFLLFVFAAGGAMHALLFWGLAVWRNPGLTERRVYCLPGGAAYRVYRILRRPPDHS